MNTRHQKVLQPSASTRAEAAVWIARLHGSNRTSQVEAGLRQWLSESEERQMAFELLTETWEKSARLRRRPFEKVTSWEFPGFRMSISRAAAAAAAIAIVATASTLFYLHSQGITTDVGEQRVLTLSDGTRVYLNTDTQIAERYDDRTRRIDLKRGEALFEVAKQANRPFVVVAGDREILALGTEFVVRRDADNLAVTLVEGKVAVAAAAVSMHGQSDNDDGATQAGGSASPITLSPGQRLTFAKHLPPKVDTPSVDKVTAWQRGQVALDSTALADAVAEMNRYSKTRLVVADPAVAAIRISGTFRAGDQEDFARALARSYRLNVRISSDEIVIASDANLRRGGT